MNLKKIGWIGLGKMGVPMVQNLINAGYELSVYNRSKAVLANFENKNVAIAQSPKELLVASEVVIVMISDDRAISDVFTGQNGLLSAEATGKIIINMSTVSGEISQEMAALLNKNGNHYIDAPVSGSLKQATEGTLVIMAGGSAEVFDRLIPIFNCLGKLALRVGETGAGNSAKLAMNALLSFHALGLAEALNFAKEKGIETSTFLELINNSALGNPFMKIKGDAILQENYTPVFALKHIVKDLQLAKDAGIDGPLANAALQKFTSAKDEIGEEDIIAIYKKLSS
jgi:3-hydroxyisobutyrate dehydrogenase